ncbi:MAG TPA: cytochrome P450, partial [Solirubrobacteraceae bacterium]|nr:cytochrome P450 [Solirubrobacteraceae bacterium]
GPRMPRALHTLAWLRRPYPFVERARVRYGDVFTIHIGPETFVVLAAPDDVKQVFTGDPAVFHAGEGNVILLPFVGRRSVLLLDDAAHMTQRRLLLPPFHGERMRRHVGLMRDVAERAVGAWPTGVPFAVRPHMQAITLEVIMRVVFGVDEADPALDALRERVRRFLDVTASPRELRKLLVLGPERAERRRVFAHAIDPVDEVIARVIADRRARGDLAERDDVLSMLLLATHDDGSPMDDRELRDELVTLLVAGHETTATALSWALERLTRHPAALERLTDEVRAGEDAYVDAVIRETLRLRPVLPFVVRRLTQPQAIGGWDLPAGVNVAPSIQLVHRRADLYPEPHAFRPERWLGVRPGPYTFLPFGGGVRRCLGAAFAETEMRAVLAAVVSRVRLRPSRPEFEPTARRVITLVPARGGEVVAA